MKMVDLDARQSIRTALDQNMVVEAAAGTGKTTELVQRIVALIEAGVTNVDRIIAVTFTEKAAGELRLRLRSKLEDARSQACDEVRRRFLEQALGHLEEARVSTIHSLCADLLRERPVEARIDPEFEVLTEAASKRLFAQALRMWLQNNLEEPPEGLRRILRRRSRKPPFETLLDAGWALAEWRDFPAAWRREVFDRDKEIDSLITRLSSFADVTGSPSRADNGLYEDTVSIRTACENIRASEAVRPRDYDLLESLLVAIANDREYGTFRKPRTGYKQFNQNLSRAQALSLHSDLLAAIQAFQDAANMDLAPLLQAELRQSIDGYQRLKERAGQFDFLDLLLLTRNLLVNSENVRRHFQQRFSHVFVDEFQDTDPLQAEILLLLCASDSAVTNWHDVTPRPGKLFIVGDPKQAIYRFRRADIASYLKVKDMLLDGGARFVELTTSFRAVPSLQLAINKAFAPEMTGDKTALQANYVPLSQSRSDHSHQPSIIALPVPEPYGSRRFSMSAVEDSLPDGVGAFVHWLLKDSGWTVTGRNRPNERIPLSPSHICLLFRRFYSFDEDMVRPYIRALECRQIPHLLVGGRSFHDREEVHTIRAALSAIEWPDDELSVFATLKGSLFAIPDDLLFEYKHLHKRFHPFRIPRELPADHLKPILDCLSILASLHRARNYRPVAETIEELLRETRSYAAFALRPSGEQVLANVLHVAELARKYEAGGGLSFRGFVEQLREAAESGETAEAPILEEGSEGVRIMSVHKAKGLEFPVVIMADITAKISAGRPDRHIDGPAGLCAISLAGCTPRELQEHAQEDLARDHAEGVRVAYVAATRARDMLVVPAIGDHPFGKWEAAEGWWVKPLYRAVYPDYDRYRKPGKLEDCPPFGKDSVLKRPDHSPAEDDNVCPGLHRVDCDGAAYDVLWWDPRALKLNAPQSFGLRQEDLLAEVDPDVTAKALRGVESWNSRLAGIREQASNPSLVVRSVSTHSHHDKSLDPNAENVEIVEVARQGERPSGARFGALVHAVLAAVPPGCSPEEISKVATLQGRILGASKEEILGASVSAKAALAHPLLERARNALARGQCRRETPITITQADGSIVEGIVDLAFLEGEVWTVVDFKTDRELAKQVQYYKRQVALYSSAIALATKKKSRGILLSI